MLISFLRAPIAALAVLAMSVTSATADTVKDIRKVSVVADSTVPSTVTKQTAQQLKQAVRSTRRPVALQRVAMDVQLSKAVRGVGAQAGRNSAQVSVVLKDGAGSPVSSERFTVNSFMPGVKAGDKALAKAIAQRIALAYQLAPARSVSAAKHGSGKRYGKPRPSAAQASGKPAAKVEEPIIIPSEAALTVRPRVRKPKVEANASASSGAESTPAPCVVTPTTSCN